MKISPDHAAAMCVRCYAACDEIIPRLPEAYTHLLRYSRICRHDEHEACNMMRQFEKAFAEPRVPLYTFRVEMRGEEAVLRLAIDTEHNGSTDDLFDGEEQTSMKWSFNTTALEWPESAKVLRDTFTKPLISVKQQLQLQKMDLAEMIAKGETGVSARATGGHMRAVTSWRAAYQTNGVETAPQEFKLELFDQEHILVRQLTTARSSPHLPDLYSLIAWMFARRLQRFQRSRDEESTSGASSGTGAEATTSDNLFDSFAADIYKAHVNVEGRCRSARAAAHGTGDGSEHPDAGGDDKARTPYAHNDTQDRSCGSWDTLSSADSPPHSHRSRSTALAADSATYCDRRMRTRPTETNRRADESAARAASTAGADSGSDDSDAEMAALFAAESTGTMQARGTQGPASTLGLLDMAADDYQPSQRRGNDFSQHSDRTQQCYRGDLSPAVLVPRPAAGATQQHSSPSIGGSSKKKIKKKKRNRKVI